MSQSVSSMLAEPPYRQKELIESSVIESEDLERIGKKLEEEKVDYIVTPTRKGPRFLEVMRMAGHWTGTTPVISEKALSFMSDSFIDRLKIVVFDDLIIRGETVEKTIHELYDQDCQPRIKVMSFAVDEEKVRSDRISLEDKTITLNGEPLQSREQTFPLEYQCLLSRSERLEYSRDEVRSFVHLNKPYDVDFSIFYSAIREEKLDSVLDGGDVYDSFNLTTTYQSKNGFERYSLLPKNGTIPEFINHIFGDVDVEPHIQKIRAYHCSDTGEFTFTPMLTFSLDENQLMEQKIFSEQFSNYNELINKGRKVTENGGKPLFRLVWFVASYLSGLYFKEELGINPSHAPSKVLHIQDLYYLFGPEFSTEILEFLDKEHRRTREQLRGIPEPTPARLRDNENRQSNPFSHEGNPFEDGDREELKAEIWKYVDNRMRSHEPASMQLATVFEGMNNREREKEGSEEEGELREIGFNVKQLHYILSQFNQSDSLDWKSISLAYDVLVDKGVQIPIFHKWNNNDELTIYERAYRHGETVRAERADLIKLLGEAITEFFEGVESGSDSVEINEKVYEKIGVLLFREINRSEMYDSLEVDEDDAGSAPIDPVVVAPGFMKYGKVLRFIEASKLPRLNNLEGRQSFTDWSTRVGIVKLNENHKIEKSYSWVDELEDAGYDYYDERSKFRLKHIANLSFIINEEVDGGLDDDGLPRSLVGITTCNDHESYIRSFKELFRLYFESAGIRNHISDVKNHIENAHGPLPEILQADVMNLSHEIRNTYKQFRYKRDIWAEMGEIIQKVHTYLSKNYTEVYELTGFYQLIEGIRKEHNLDSTDDLATFKSQATRLGLLSLSLAESFRDILAAYHQSASESELLGNSARRNQNYHWNKLISETSSDSFESELRQLPEPGVNDPDTPAEPNNLEELLEVIDVVEHNYEHLYSHYEEWFKTTWSEQMEDLFPAKDRQEIVIAEGQKSPTSSEWVIWFEIKGSGVDINEISPFTNYLLGELDEGNLTGGLKGKSGHIFCPDGVVVDRLQDLVEKAEANELRLRMGVLNDARDMQSKLKKHEGTGEIGDEFIEDVAEGLGRVAESNDDGTDPGYHSLILSDSIFVQHAEDFNDKILANRKGNVKEETRPFPKRGHRIDVSFKIVTLHQGSRNTDLSDWV